MLRQFRMLEIEIHSKCNRKCAWCPNRSLNRTDKNNLPEQLYLKVLKELKENKFGQSGRGGVITYSRYNEPLYDIDLLRRRLIQAKDILPDVLLVANTNGDFVTKEALDDLSLNHLTINDYDCIGLDRCIERLGNEGIYIKSYDRRIINAGHGSMGINYIVDFPKNVLLEDRGGFLKDDMRELRWRNNRNIRKAACIDPSHFIGIDYNGNVVPCCQIRSDNPDHTAYVLGNIAEKHIAEILFSDKAVWFRELLLSGDYRTYPEPCKNCQKQPSRYISKDPVIDFPEGFWK